jgi:hypothetical protein
MKYPDEVRKLVAKAIKRGWMKYPPKAEEPKPEPADKAEQEKAKQ